MTRRSEAYARADQLGIAYDEKYAKVSDLEQKIAEAEAALLAEAAPLAPGRARGASYDPKGGSYSRAVRR